MYETTTPIEDRIAWKIHHSAFDAAKAKGANFHEATLAGFASTSPAPGEQKRDRECKMSS